MARAEAKPGAAEIDPGRVHSRDPGGQLGKAHKLDGRSTTSVGSIRREEGSRAAVNPQESEYST
ncbi:MAG: hypothetical protein RLY70_3708 [Planctomycetota bacterium]|jgi:hypothetical protein